MRTDALKNKKNELESKLNEVEKAISTFSRKVVYVADTQWKYKYNFYIPLKILVLIKLTSLS